MGVPQGRRAERRNDREEEETKERRKEERQKELSALRGNNNKEELNRRRHLEETMDREECGGGTEGAGEGTRNGGMIRTECYGGSGERKACEGSTRQ